MVAVSNFSHCSLFRVCYIQTLKANITVAELNYRAMVCAADFSHHILLAYSGRFF